MIPPRIKVGVTSWAERSLVRSGWYPPGARSAEARLRYYASRFPIVENDMAYYAVPERRHAELWSARTPDGFTMNVKAFALLTGHYTNPHRLPPDLRAALPPSVRARERIYARHVGREVLDELETRFCDAMRPLYDSGRLGVLLFQFPVWFPISRDNEGELIRIAERFAPYRVAIELRNATWLSPENRAETFSLLADHGLLYTSVDEPQGFVSSLPPLAVATGDLAVVRLHGRAAARWDRANRDAAQRFEYFYSDAELAEWVPRIHHLARTAKTVHVLFNNCYTDYAVRNAARMTELLTSSQPMLLDHERGAG